MTKPEKINRVNSVLLAGGASRRFGVNKALAHLDGEPMIKSIAQTLAKIFDQYLLVTNTPQTYEFLNWPMTGDLFAGAGPLAGIHAALHYFKTPAIFVTGCDMPLLNEKLIRYLCNISGDWDVIMPHPLAGPEPLHAVYRRTALPVIEQALKQGERKINRVLLNLRVRTLDEDELLKVAADLSSFHNINYPADLATLPKKRKKHQTDLSLTEAQKLVINFTKTGRTETLSFSETLNRVAAESIRSKIPIPAFTHSTMDGFAVRTRDLGENISRQNPQKLEIIDEIAAGRTDLPILPSKKSIRIMTGGAIPPGADQVIPFEKCLEADHHILVRQTGRAGNHLRKTGATLKKGRVIIKKGELITPDHLAIMASSGVNQALLYQQPRVALLCTGSELVNPEMTLKTGQVVSSNRFLLTGLIQQENCLPIDLGIEIDKTQMIVKKIKNALNKNVQMILTTGGMGPGKFDLMAEVFTELKIEMIYQSINVKPGRTTMCGSLGQTIFFALPGPPPAVRILFTELVRPALRRILGHKKLWQESYRARLSEPLTIRKKGILNLKGGIMHREKTTILVRAAHGAEAINCIIAVPPHRCQVKAGEMVTVHPA
ncbi:MAG: NTP transferase domain-containing protein [Proteobacteria bacterium]|nr:NTP transferase domain-containing protein [Pseudomonadota bacterium]MBU1714009.1 NTP transferase domain-containing protein [Pseudomonadota bacterium]